MANSGGMSRGGLNSDPRVDDANDDSVESESRAGGRDEYPSSSPHHGTEETGTPETTTPALFHGGGGGGRSGAAVSGSGSGSGTDDADPSAPGADAAVPTEGVGSRGWTDWDREEGDLNLRSAVQRQTSELVDEDAASVGQLSTGALSLGLNSLGLAGRYDDVSGSSSGDDEEGGSSPESTGVSGSEDGSIGDGGASSGDDDDDDESTAPVSAASPAVGLGAGLEGMAGWESHSSGSHSSADNRRRGSMERGPSARAFSSSAESKFIRPSSETLQRGGGGGGQRRPSGASSAGSRGDSDDGGPTVRSVGSIGTRTAGRMAGGEDRKFQRPSLVGMKGELKGEGGGWGNTSTRAKAMPFAKRRPSLDFNILDHDEPDPTPWEQRRTSSPSEEEEDPMSEVLFNAAEAAARRRDSLDSISLSKSGKQDHAMAKSLSRRLQATKPERERSLQNVDIMIKSDSDKRKSMMLTNKRTRTRKRLRMASKICAALAAAAAITLGTLAAVLPPGSGGPVVGAVKQGSREAVVYVQGWVSSDEIDNELMGTKRSAADPSTQSADRTEALMDAAPSVAGGDEGGGGNRKELEVRSYAAQSRPHMRGFLTETVVGDPTADYSAGGNGGGERLRDLEEGLAAASASKSGQYPNVLPPLHSFNTAERPLDEGIHIPPHVTTNLADVWSRPLRQADVPLLWAPSTANGGSHDGSDLLRSALSRCLGAVEASELGGDTHGMLLAVIDRAESEALGLGERRYVNIDVTSPKGIKRARRTKLVRSGMIDLLASPHLADTSAVFGDVAAYDPRDTNVARGRAFALFRHPVRDAAAKYSALLSAAHETGAPFHLTLLEYARSDLVEENPLVRSLTGEFLSAHKKKGAGPVTAQHVEVAKEVVRRKVLVGLSEFMPQSMERFESYFGWGAARPEGRACLDEAAERAGNTLASENVQGLHPETDEYAELARRNWADVQLYHYARVLFEEQAALLPPVAEPELPFAEVATMVSP